MAPTQVEHVLTILVLAAGAACQGLVAIWAAHSKIHWFWRALAVWSAVMLLVPIRAFQPALLFAIASPMVLILVWAYQIGLGRTSVATTRTLIRFRFGLRDLLLGFLLFGLVIVGVSAILRPFAGMPLPIRPSAYPFVATALALVIALPSCVVTGPRRKTAVLLLCISLPLSLLVLRGTEDLNQGWSVEGWGMLLHVSDLAANITWPGLTAFVGCLVGLVTVPVFLFHAWIHGATRTSRHTAGIAGILWAIVTGLPICALYWSMLWPTPFPPDPTDTPNHFAEIVSIAEQISPDPVAGEYEHQIGRLLPLLDAPNYMLFKHNSDIRRDFWDVSSSNSIRYLGRALGEDSRAAAGRGDFDSASRLALANIRLGTSLRTGGVLVDEVIGNAVEGIGHYDLIPIRVKVSPNVARELINVLQRSTEEQEPLEVILTREYALSDRSFGGWETRLRRIIRGQLLGESDDSHYFKARQEYQARRVLLQTDLALRIYWHENGRLPNELCELVPDLLPKPLVDPYTNQSLVYRPSGESFVLYSVGADATDDGGRFGTSYDLRRSQNIDFDLETMTRK